MSNIQQLPPLTIRLARDEQRQPATAAQASHELPRTTTERLIAWAFRPSSAFLPFVFLGFLLWLSPPDDGCGFYVRESLSFASVLILSIWYGNIFLFARLGEMLADLTPRFRSPPIDELTFYYVVTAFSVVGGFACWITVIRSGVSVFTLLTENQANEFKTALYDQYTFIHTLRCSVSFSGGLALFRIFCRGRRSLIDFLNVALTLCIAAISARLFILLALYMCFGLALRFGGLEKLRLHRMLAVAGCLFATLMALTWTREANSYSMYGYNNPVMMQFMQIKTHVGAPFQVSLGVARIAWASTRFAPSDVDLWGVIRPTFLTPRDQKVDFSGGVGHQWYLNQIDIDPELTMNSALAELYEFLGSYAFPFMSVVAVVFAWLTGIFWKSTGPLFMIALVLLYAFSELWRAYAFDEGRNFFLLAEALFAGAVATVVHCCRHEGDAFFAPRH